MSSTIRVGDPLVDVVVPSDSAGASGVSWGAVFAGATGAAALTIVMFMLGIGLGLTSTSPWDGDGVSAKTVGVSALLWTTLTQIVAAIVGGYLAGRLRVKWVNVHNDEVYFRDTAHGFIAWSVATLVMSFVVASLTAGAIGSGARAVSAVASGAVSAGGMATVASQAMPGSSSASSATPGASPIRESTMAYSIDSLFRVDPKTRAAPVSPAETMEVTRIFATDLAAGELPAQDKTYVAQVIVARTGSTQADAEQRVDTLFNTMKSAAANAKQKAKEAADAARKASIWAALWTVISLLAGAFSASFAATFGGKLRDKIV